jgi:tRNA1Val (adenine37-N6)-methyltransferase
VLLGACCNVADAQSILDVGTGTGLIALMLAQRTDADISAIEIDEASCLDAQLNFRNSPWSERIQLYAADFNEFQATHPGSFDLIVSNPPFFRQSLKSADSASSMARHDVALSFVQLITGSKKLLNFPGRLAVIIPVEACDDFRETARLEGFYLCRKTMVIPRTGKSPKRVLLEFSVTQAYPEVGELVILEDKNRYSEAFIELTKEFYLNC